MPIADAKKRKIGAELIDWIYLGIRTGARQAVAEYHVLKATDPLRAEAHLLRAVNMPVRARARINETRRVYELRFGAGTFNAFIASCLALGRTVTIGELNAELVSLEANTATLKSMKASGSTNDQIAAWIETNWDNEVNDWKFLFHVGYQDSWT